ncbi:protein starmaker-like [Anthonomus grandis grandis]|uniref:protein starmaker-like n=1 Tax=Anthonomus grandis grandis TaxID=2921223 RepID=UPI002165926F|nr:protein starmaker-like [Anthonomus grandis grandis]
MSSRGKKLVFMACNNTLNQRSSSDENSISYNRIIGSNVSRFYERVGEQRDATPKDKNIEIERGSEVGNLNVSEPSVDHVSQHSFHEDDLALIEDSDDSILDPDFNETDDSNDEMDEKLKKQLLEWYDEIPSDDDNYLHDDDDNNLNLSREKFKQRESFSKDDDDSVRDPNYELSDSDSEANVVRDGHLDILEADALSDISNEALRNHNPSNEDSDDDRRTAEKREAVLEELERLAEENEENEEDNEILSDHNSETEQENSDSEEEELPIRNSWYGKDNTK